MEENNKTRISSQKYFLCRPVQLLGLAINLPLINLAAKLKEAAYLWYKMSAVYKNQVIEKSFLEGIIVFPDTETCRICPLVFMKAHYIT